MEEVTEWPTIQLSSIKNEIDNITINNNDIIQIQNESTSIDDELVKRISKLIQRNQDLLNIKTNIPSMKSLLLLRQWNLVHSLNLIDFKKDNESLYYSTSQREIELQNLLEKEEFIITIHDSDNSKFSTIRRQVFECFGVCEQYISLLQSMNNTQLSFSILEAKLAAIPYPSLSQIEKDLKREVFILNGCTLNGSQGMKSIKSAIKSIISSCLLKDDEEKQQSILDTILQRISRTRIGEYCYNTIMKLLPIEEGTLIIAVNNEEICPIELNMCSKLFRIHNEWKWGICISTTFSFNYSIININDVTNMTERITTVNEKCHYYTCIGLAEYEGQNCEECGDLVISFQS